MYLILVKLAFLYKIVLHKNYKLIKYLAESNNCWTWYSQDKNIKNATFEEKQGLFPS